MFQTEDDVWQVEDVMFQVEEDEVEEDVVFEVEDYVFQVEDDVMFQVEEDVCLRWKMMCCDVFQCSVTCGWGRQVREVVCRHEGDTFCDVMM